MDHKAVKDAIGLALGSESVPRYVDVPKESKTATVRFDSADTAKKAAEKAASEEGLQVGGRKVKGAKVLEGEQEEAFWAELDRKQKARAGNYWRDNDHTWACHLI